MTNTKERLQKLKRHQLDRRLDIVRSVLPQLQRPRNGWIAAVRTALGMSQADLGHRLAVSQQSVSQLERREIDDAVTLKALREAAQAMDGTLVYAIIPNQPIGNMMEERARDIALRMVASVHHSMSLEDQETDANLDRQVAEIAQRLMRTPSRLWTVPDDS